MADRRRVLVIEDDEVVRGTIVEALVFEGYEARGAADGTAALRILDGWIPDLIVLDLMMPGMDGWAFRDEQRKRPAVRDVPIVVVSARRDLAQAAEPLAPAAMVAKPFDLDTLLDTIKDSIAGPTPRVA